MATTSRDTSPVIRRWLSKTPSGNPLPRRGQVKERIARDVAAALATAAALACGDRTAGAGAKQKKCVSCNQVVQL
ncbi:hypothetical protein BAE44_0022349 [Dichanthelium oligosanthes]|uniref:Uncharacterized protein n=1 Tax=Dichanthelium oligosanthes TaxID=888268 RepID=A0A1E5UUU4_9POAL|nr:hypothetical protein BAE44_0022349 [Dichanthelium oligosanthes]